MRLRFKEVFWLNPKPLEKTLEMVFKTAERKALAYKILQTLKRREREGQAFKATERVHFCSEEAIPLSKYDSVLMRLKDVGLVRKEGGRLLLSNDFVYNLLDEWLKFRSQ